MYNMYYEDLSPYHHLLSFKINEVKNVGWLDSHHPYRTGPADTSLLQKLKRIAMASRVRQMRERIPCQICGRDQIQLKIGDQTRFLGTTDIWIPATESRIFAAPDLIIHYIQSHGYCPPEEFWQAVDLFDDLVSTWNGKEEYDIMIRKYSSQG